MFCSHCMCFDSDLVVQKINKQTSKQADKWMKKQCCLYLFYLNTVDFGLYMKLPTFLFCSMNIYCSPVFFNY